MKNNKWIWIAVAVVAVIVVIILLCGGKNKSELVVTSEKAEQGSIQTTVTATGEIQPVYKVEVGTQVSGKVEKIYVDYNSQVHKGMLLAELDKSLLNEQVKQCKATLASATNNKNLAQKNFDRTKKLFESKAATQEEYDEAENTLVQAENQRVTAQSNYDNARTNVKYAEIYSPIDGIVLDKSVEEGQTVASSFSTPTLFTIANDMTKMQVEADVDEADIGQVRIGQRVTFTVDAFPNTIFDGTVKQVRIEPTVTNNVVTYTVIIDAPNPKEILYPGMTANISIIIEEEEGLLIPLEATYFSLTSEQQQRLAKKGYDIQITPTAPNQKSVVVVDGKTLRNVVVDCGLDDGARVVVRNGLTAESNIVVGVSEVQIGSGEREAAENPLQMGPPKQKQR